MKPWERKLYDWGLLGYLVRDVIGAEQEESFGIRQNHSMNAAPVARSHPEAFRRLPLRLFRACHRSGRAVYEASGGKTRSLSFGVARGAIAGRHAGRGLPQGRHAAERPRLASCETVSQCPDCCRQPDRGDDGTFRCRACGFQAPDEGGVYNLIRSGVSARNSTRAAAPTSSTSACPTTKSNCWKDGAPGRSVRQQVPLDRRTCRRPLDAGGARGRHGCASGATPTRGSSRRANPCVWRRPPTASAWGAGRSNAADLFMLEADLPDAEEYRIDLYASPSWTAPPDNRQFTVTISMVRLVSKGNSGGLSLVELFRQTMRNSPMRRNMRNRILTSCLPAAALLLLTGCNIEGLGGFGNSSRFQEDFHHTYNLKAGGRLSIEKLQWRHRDSRMGKRLGRNLRHQVRQHRRIAQGDQGGHRRFAHRDSNSHDSPPGGAATGAPSTSCASRTRRTWIASTHPTAASAPKASRARRGCTPPTAACATSKSRGDLEVQTSNGSIDATDAKARPTLRTTNGAVNVEGLRGALETTTSNGRIRARIAQTDPGKPLRASTTNGSIDLAVESFTDNDIRASTSNGSITVRLPALAQRPGCAHPPAIPASRRTSTFW